MRAQMDEKAMAPITDNYTASLNDFLKYHYWQSIHDQVSGLAAILWIV